MVCVLTFLLLISPESRAQPAAGANQSWSLDAFLQEAAKMNELIQAARLQKEASTLRQHQGDLAEHSPLLQAEYSYTDDQRETIFPAQQRKRKQTTRYSLGVSKKFITVLFIIPRDMSAIAGETESTVPSNTTSR